MKDPLGYCEDTISQKHVLEMAWLDLCKRLKEIRDGEMFKGRWDSFEDFLNDPQMGMDKSTASRMITIHEKLILEYKVKPTVIANAGGWTKVAEVMPVINTKEDAEEWLSKCEHLSKADVRKEVKRVQSQIDGKDCKHKDTYQLVLKVCRYCGDKEVTKSNE